MRKTTALLSAAALLATPVMAEARGFKSDLATTVTGPIKIEVVVSEDLAYRANNLPKKLSDRGSTSRLNAAFANNGKYGDRAIEDLIEEMQDELSSDFAKQGIVTSDTAPTLFRVTLEMAKPNRPTFKQLSVDPSLSFESFGSGGAEISAELVSAGGDVIGTMEYDRYETLTNDGFRPVGVWQDADRAISRFSSKASKRLAAMGAGGNS